MNETRLIELETKYAHQEIALEELQNVTFEQHRVIEKLVVQLKRLTDRFDAAVGPEVGSGDQKPPHY